MTLSILSTQVWIPAGLLVPGRYIRNFTALYLFTSIYSYKMDQRLEPNMLIHNLALIYNSTISYMHTHNCFPKMKIDQEIGTYLYLKTWRCPWIPCGWPGLYPCGTPRWARGQTSNVSSGSWKHYHITRTARLWPRSPLDAEGPERTVKSQYTWKRNARCELRSYDFSTLM